jgi:hypothetical protein
LAAPELESFCIFVRKFHVMPALNVIYNEINAVPVRRLDELYQFIRSLSPAVKQQEKESSARREKILSFAGAFNDMPAEQYADFTAHWQTTRATLFNRPVDL